MRKCTQCACWLYVGVEAACSLFDNRSCSLFLADTAAHSSVVLLIQYCSLERRLHGVQLITSELLLDAALFISQMAMRPLFKFDWPATMACLACRPTSNLSRLRLK
jgi:hypothetical protein